MWSLVLTQFMRPPGYPTGNDSFMNEFMFFLFYTSCGILMGLLVCFLCNWVIQRRTKVVTVTVEESGPKSYYFPSNSLYHSLLSWLAKNLKNLEHSEAKSESEPDECGKASWRVDSVPGFGTPIKFKYQGQWIELLRTHTPEIKSSYTTKEKIVLTTHKQNGALIYKLLEECMLMKKEGDGRTRIYTVHQCCWDDVGHLKKRRLLSSVILAEEVKTKLIKDVMEFRASEKWYVDRGIPYRRGYLLHGPPGCGKSSFIRSIAGEIGLDICILSLTSTGMTDDKLAELMNFTPGDSIILLEDLDAVFTSREDWEAPIREQNMVYEGMAHSTVTFGGLLNALDGVASTEGRLVFMTSNNVERLDSVLLRPGRVDLKMLVDLPNDDQLKRIFLQFFPQCGEDTANEFVKKIRLLRSGTISMADVQGLFMFHKESPRGAIDGIGAHFKEQMMLNHKSMSNLRLFT